MTTPTPTPTPTPNRGYVTTAAGRVHVRTAGPADAPPLVLIHQTASSGAMFAALMAHLAPRFRLIAADTPGFGQTPPPAEAPTAAPTIARYAATLAATLDALGVPTATLFGHHTGAAIAVELAATQPARVARLVLSGPPLLDDAARAALAATPARTPRADGSHLTDIWRTLAAKDRAVSLDVLHRELVLSASALASWHLAYHAVAAHPFAARLDAVGAPTLILRGDRDSLAASAEPTRARLAAAGTPARVVTLAGAATYVCDTHSAQVAAALAEHAA